jgi:dimethylargininase
VEAALRRWHQTLELPADARLEGGDVLHVEDTTYVGLTARTNERGVEALREFLAPAGRRVVAVPVDKYLHLKTAATYLGNGTLVAVHDFDGVGAFDVDEVIRTDEGEPVASNCLRVNGDLLVVAGNPRTELRLRAFGERHGVRVVPLEISEFEKGEGSLTCLSLVW